MKISDIQRNAIELSTKHGWNNIGPQERFTRLIGDVGELANEVVKYGSNGENKPSTDQLVAFKIYDVVWNLCDLANQLDIDLEPYFVEKCKVNQGREWNKV